MVNLGLRRNSEGTLVRDLKPFALNELPSEMPEIDDPLRNLICGQMDDSREYLYVCESVAEIQRMFRDKETNIANSLLWYTGVLRFPAADMRQN